jgi:hypothetical protein
MEQMRADHLDRPHRSRLSPDHPRYAEILAAHRAAVQNGLPTYRDPLSGYSVFTAAFLADRGACCDTGCRHCPFVGAAIGRD